VQQYYASHTEDTWMDTVKILTLIGDMSDEEYTIINEKPDRKGCVRLQDINSGKEVLVNSRRIIRDYNDDKESVVIQLGDKHRAKCPKCSYVLDIQQNHTAIKCPEHGISRLIWSNKTMDAETQIAENQTDTPTISETPAEAPSEKVKSEPKSKKKHMVDFEAIANDPNLELWTKKIRFDNATIDSRAHVLIYIVENHCTPDAVSRKLCFNTYDGSSGKNPIPLAEFLGNDEKENKRWYSVKSLEKERKSLTNKGYTKE